MQKQTLTIPAISCGHCVAAVKDELSGIEGVNAVDGDPETKQVTVEWDTPADIQKIRDKLREIQYPAN